LVFRKCKAFRTVLKTINMQTSGSHLVMGSDFFF